jgi:hypothetical protein
MSKATGGTVSVLVTPLLQDGNEMVCAIEAADGASKNYVKGGVVILNPPGDYDLVFELDDTNFPGLQFDGNDPFWCSANSCPRGPSSSSHFGNPHVPSGSNGRQAKVNTNPSNGKKPFHYSLNFSDGTRCDPIVINT